MPSVPDLVRLTRLDSYCSTDPQYTQHIRHISRSGQRPVRQEERWKRRKALGKGSFGAVHLEECSQGDNKGGWRAVKEIQKPTDCHYYRELEALALFSYPQSVQYEHCFVKSFGWFDDDKSIFITMEYLPYGDLQQYLSSPLSEYEGQQIVFQLLEGLDFMHDNGFAHRDLKPANILVVRKGPQWWVKIADFGISKRAKEGATAFRTVTGTPAFTAPEVLGYIQADDGSGNAYTNAVDLWSTGVITFAILTGDYLFKDQRRLGQYVLGVIGFPSDTLATKLVSRTGCDFVKTLMAPEPKDRPSVKETLRHPWFMDLDNSTASNTQRPGALRSLEYSRPSAFADIPTHPTVSTRQGFARSNARDPSSIYKSVRPGNQSARPGNEPLRPETSKQEKSKSPAIAAFKRAAMAATSRFYDFKPVDKNGIEYPLSALRGKVVLVVNTASKCGFTPQFTDLEKLYQEVKASHPDFEILGFPSNQFGNQEPGTNDEIQSFCKVNYGVTFPVLGKTEVNGDNVEPVYEWMKKAKPGIMRLERIKWNFEKFLIGRDGMVKERWASTTKPQALKKAILDELKKEPPLIWKS